MFSTFIITLFIMKGESIKMSFAKKIKDFLIRKDVIITPQRYLIEVLSQMAQAVFASLLIGLIFKTTGEQGNALFKDFFIFDVLIELGQFSMKMVGSAIGVAVAHGVKAPPLVLYTSAITGASGANIGG